ncbi:hypothetical protein FQN54_000097 [Arachnomyces sp. PD_36]|nr:hypothetical protein FQN54_000097 [Arachnomyces sp. PD_36]
MGPPQTIRLTSTLRILLPRLRLLQKKDNASSISQRRELAHLLESGKETSARIRVEHVIANDIVVEVLEMLELYCELLLARAGVLDQMAFSERGVKARAKAKAVESARVRAKAAKAAGRAGRKKGRGGKAGAAAAAPASTGGSGGGFGWFRSSPKPTTKPAPQPALAPESSTTPKQEHEQDPEQDTPHPEEEEEDEEDPLSDSSSTSSTSSESYYLDPTLDEAASAIFYTTPRLSREVRELHNLRLLLTERWGKDFASLASENKLEGVRVPERLVKSLKVRSPGKELVENYLREIARAYKVEWPRGGGGGDEEEEDLGAAPALPGAPRGGVDGGGNKGGGGDGAGGDGGDIQQSSTGSNDKGKQSASDPSTQKKTSPPPPVAAEPTTTVDGRVIPEVDELARRFAALKR